MRFAILFALPLALLSACAREVIVGVDPMRHVMLVDLKDSRDAREFSADCFQLLDCPAAMNVVAGPKLELLSPGEFTDFNAAVEIGLRSADGCAKLVDDPAYRSLIAKWQPRAHSIRTATFGPRCEPEPAAPAAGAKPATGN